MAMAHGSACGGSRRWVLLKKHRRL
ncbi:uncharacterized protein G2W53_034090 [Senna tora]|uniref:Uncharacterized protein n=1 Tax=Senna tora TaxID=362788 RepID=A0A834SZP6_9FABA|nr:uncharacterized protein G2W53_034090 [Senna tora]